MKYQKRVSILFFVMLISVLTPLMKSLADVNPAPGQVTSEDANGCRIERFEIFSPAMKRSIRAWAMLPPGYGDDRVFPLLIALHGRNAPYDTWAKMAPLQKGLMQKPMLVAGFEADRASWYLDSTLRPDSQFETFFFDEFLPALEKRYRLDKNERAITDFSMGGFGAMHFALKKPELFSSVSVLSGPFWKMEAPMEKMEERFSSLIGTFQANPQAYEALDPQRRLLEIKNHKTRFPPIYVECGTEDSYLERNRAFGAFLKENDFNSKYHEVSGAHNWAYWRDASARVLEFHRSKIDH